MLALPTRRDLLLHLPSDAVVAEIGVQRGRFARQILRYASPRQLHLIDCWEHQHDQAYRPDAANAADDRHNANLRRTRQRMRRGIRSGRVYLHRGYSVPTLAGFPDHFFDWVYVDANHTLQGALADLEACLAKVKPEGIIAGHDYIDNETWRALNFGVVEAVDRFCTRHDWELIMQTEEPGNEVQRRGNPSFALRRRGLGLPNVTPRRWWSTFLPRRAA